MLQRVSDGHSAGIKARNDKQYERSALGIDGGQVCCLSCFWVATFCVGGEKENTLTKLPDNPGTMPGRHHEKLLTFTNLDRQPFSPRNSCKQKRDQTEFQPYAQKTKPNFNRKQERPNQ